MKPDFWYLFSNLNYVAKFPRAKSKIGHHCDERNFFSQLSFLSSQKPRHFMYITWINNHCPSQKHQWGPAMINHVTVATHLKVRRCSKIPSIFIFLVVLLLQLCNFTHRVYYTIKQPTYFSKKGKKIEPQLNTLLWQHNLWNATDGKKWNSRFRPSHLQIVLL